MENSKKKNWLIAAAALVAVIVIAVICYAVGRKPDNTTETETQKPETEAVIETETESEMETETESEMEIETESETESETETETETESETETGDAKKDTDAEQTEEAVPTEAAELIVPETGSQNQGMEDAKGTVLDDTNLVIDSVGSYAGNFLEDGSDEPVANVAAIRITNNSLKMLQIAEITFQVNDSETATFKVTDLPAGAAAMVLEESKREYSEADDYSYGETATAYMDTPSLQEDKFEITMEKGKLLLKNKTKKAYSKIYVYYKYVQMGGDYMGGITYRTPFENVPAGGEAEAVANHLNPDSSQIVDVQPTE